MIPIHGGQSGGKPLLQEGIMELLSKLSRDDNLNVEIKNNGSVPLDKFCGLSNPPSFTMECKLPGRIATYLSPVFGKIDMDEIVEFMKDNHMNGVALQMQLHKIIWDPDKRGV